MNLREDFPHSSLEEWQQKIEADLKGSPISELFWNSELGAINPVLFNYENKFARIPARTNSNENWLITQSFTCENPSHANTEILEGLKGGVNSIHLFKLKTQDTETVLKDIMLDIIHTLIVVTADQVLPMQTALKTLCQKSGWEYDKLQLKITSDSIGQYILGRLDNTAKEINDVFVYGCIYANCGATIQNEMALTLAHAHEYLVAQISSGIEPKEAAEKIHFQMAIGNSYFAEIAKIRAFRTLWATLLKTYGITNVNTWIHCETSNLYYSNLDMHNNLLRGTSAAMASVFGGANSIEVLPYDKNTTDKQSDSNRLSKNILLLLQEEAYLNQVENPSDGSYYIEQLTDIIIEKSWAIFQDIENQGGFLNYFEHGNVAELISKDLKIKKERFEKLNLALIGTNKFLNKNEKNHEHYQNLPSDTKFLASFRLAQIKISN